MPVLWQLDQAADVGCSLREADQTAAWMQIDGGGSIDLDAGSQEILALLSATSQSNISRQNSKLPALLTSLPGSHTAPAVQKVCQSTSQAGNELYSRIGHSSGLTVAALYVGGHCIRIRHR